MEYETAQELYDALSAPFPVEMIEWRVGTTNKKWKKPDEPLRGIPLCYIDARAVMDRLDTVCGPDGWQCNYTTVGSSAICNLGIKMPSGEWLWKADGAGQTDMEGEKGALSDALKRAAVRWGIGRYLYDLKAERIQLEQRGETAFIPDAEKKKLDNLHEDFAQKCGWGNPTDIATYKVLNRVVDQFVTDAVGADKFRKDNGGMIAQLRVAQRRHLNNKLDRIGAPAEAAE